jgi:multicomponent Na+:H+ antiporter subunit D
VIAAAVVAAFLTLFSMTKIWSGVFWNPKEREPQATPHPPGRLGGPVLMVVPTATLVVITIALGVFAGPIYEHITTTATGLLDPAVYRSEVLGR